MKYVILCDANVEEGSNDSFCQVNGFHIYLNNCDTYRLNSNSNSKPKG